MNNSKITIIFRDSTSLEIPLQFNGAVLGQDIMKSAFAQMGEDEQFLLIGDFAIKVDDIRYAWITRSQ